MVLGQGKMGVTEPHHPALLAALAKELGCAPGDIVDFELNVCDTQPGVISGGAPPASLPRLQNHGSLGTFALLNGASCHCCWRWGPGTGKVCCPS